MQEIHSYDKLHEAMKQIQLAENEIAFRPKLLCIKRGY